MCITIPYICAIHPTFLKVKNKLPELFLLASLLGATSVYAQDNKNTRSFPKPVFQVDVKDACDTLAEKMNEVLASE